MNTDTFRVSIEDFVNKHYTKSQNVIISTLFTALVPIYERLNLTNGNSSINDLSVALSLNSDAVYQSFADTFKELRKTLKDSTFKTKSCCVRNALEILGADRAKLITPTKERPIKVKDPRDINNYMPTKLRSLSDDDSKKKFIIERFNRAMVTTGCKSDKSKKIMLVYWARFIEVMGDLKTIDLSFDHIIDLFQDHIKTTYDLIYFHHMLYCITEEWDIKIKELKTYFDIKDSKEDKDGDKDFLTPTQQENIWKATNGTLEKLFISILFTTGLRVGGLCNIKISDVYDVASHRVNDYGSTLEKGSKIRTFPIFDMVKPHLIKWIEDNKYVDTPYLFHNLYDSSKPRSTRFFQRLFKEIAKRCGYEGDEIHVHAVRHSVARNLLESGNSMESIGKFLGHASPETTAKFYANLSTMETVNRMDTSAIGGFDKKKVHVPQIPQFDIDRKKVKKKHKFDKLKHIDIGGKSIAEEKCEKRLEQLRQQRLNRSQMSQ